MTANMDFARVVLHAICWVSSRSWSAAFDNHGETRSISLDISLAFNWVWHEGLLSKSPSFVLHPTLIVSFMFLQKAGHRRPDRWGSISAVPREFWCSPRFRICAHFFYLLITLHRPPTLYRFADNATLYCSLSYSSP